MPSVYELARQRIAAITPPTPPKVPEKKPKPAYTKPVVQLTAEERREAKRKYNREYYAAHKEIIRKRENERRKKNSEYYRSYSLQ